MRRLARNYDKSGLVAKGFRVSQRREEEVSMIKKSLILATICILSVVCLLSCDKNDGKVRVDEKEIQGFKTKTFFNSNDNIEVTLASDGNSTIVAIPIAAIGRQNQMGDDEYTCLKACKDIADLEKRLNCILKCPTSKNYKVFIF
jgi:hypothetical protein